MSTLATNTNGACWSEHMSHSTPENNTWWKWPFFTSHILGWQNKRQTYHTTPFWSSHTDHYQWNFHYRGSTRLGNWFHHTYPHDYSYNVIHTWNTSENNQQMPQDAKPTTFKGNSLASVMVEQTILQTALTSIQIFSSRKKEIWSLDRS